MNRRVFAQAMAATALGAAAGPLVTTAKAETVASTATPFQLSVMLWTVFADLPFEERLARVAEAGYSNVELVGEYAKWSERDFARANEARKRLGIRFDATAGMEHAAHTKGIADPAERAPFLEELKQSLMTMETLECPAMIVLSGSVVERLSREEQHRSCVETLKRAAELVERRQIGGEPARVLLECIHAEESPHYFLQSATEAIEIVREVNHPQVQFLYDIFHEQMGFGQLIEKLEKHIDVIGLIHVADVPGRHEPGTGEINYGNIYRKLAELRYLHKVAMEFLPTDDEVKTLRAAREGVARAVA